MFARKLFWMYLVGFMMMLSTTTLDILDRTRDVVESETGVIQSFDNMVLTQDMLQFDNNTLKGRVLLPLLSMYDDSVAVLVKDTETFNREWEDGVYNYGVGVYKNGGCLLTAVNVDNPVIDSSVILSKGFLYPYSSNLMTKNQDGSGGYVKSMFGVDRLLDPNTLYYTELIEDGSGEVIGVVCSQYVVSERLK